MMITVIKIEFIQINYNRIESLIKQKAVMKKEEIVAYEKYFPE